MCLFKNNHGFSMVESMIGIGLLTAISLGAVKLSENQKSVQMSLNQSSEVTQTLILLKQTIFNKDACELNFKDKTIDSTVTEIRDRKGEIVLATGQEVKGYILNEIRLDKYNPDTSRLRVVFTFKKQPGMPGIEVVRKYTRIFVDVQNNKIAECMGIDEMAAGTLMNMFCRGLDPDSTLECEDNLRNLELQMKALYCGEGHPFLEYDSTTQKCRPLDANKRCASGLFRGYGPNNIVCYNPPTGSAM